MRIGAIAALALGSQAWAFQSATTFDLLSTTPYQPVSSRAAGDTVDLAVTGFETVGTVGGAFLYGPHSHTLGTTSDQFTPGIDTSFFLDSFVTTVGNTRIVRIEMNSIFFGRAIAAPGGTINGSPVNVVQFELGFNAGTDLLNDPDKIGPITNGTFEAIDDVSGPFFVGVLSVSDAGTSVAVRGGVQVPAGNDIFDPAVVGFEFNSLRLRFEYEIVPAPGGAAVLGVFGLAAARRRRP